jgi:predicted nucleic acid-binding protein
MITAIDSNVLFDVFLPDPVFARSSRSALEKCSEEGGLVMAEPVYAELAAWFPSQENLDGILNDLAIGKEGVTSPHSTFHIRHVWCSLPLVLRILWRSLPRAVA